MAKPTPTTPKSQTQAPPAATTSKKSTAAYGIISLNTYTSPKIVEKESKEWVEYGEDNNYFQYLQDRINGSPTNNAIVNGISQMIYGAGLEATNSSDNIQAYTEMLLLFAPQDIERVCYDFKAMGQACLKVRYSLDRKKILKTVHFPIEKIRCGKVNDDGVIDTYFYSQDWSDLRKYPAKSIPAFGTSEEGEELLYIKPYKTGFFYYSPVDYQGGLQYAELEEEISNFHLNNILNGMAPSMLINFNNGTPTEEKQKDIERTITQKFSGTSQAGKFILAFNDSAETKADITPVQLSEAHLQYQFLSEESTKKIMLSHRVVSPMLLGVKDNTGLGNNADEIKTATILMDNMVIRPFQNTIIIFLNKILAYNETSLDLYFKTLQPLEFTSLDNAQSVDQVEKETGVKMSKELPNDLANTILETLKGEQVPSEWMLMDIRPASDKEALFNAMLNKINLASTISSTSELDSVQDSSMFKIRYKYAGSQNPQRDFCKKMIGADMVYRYEDLDKDASNNAGFGIGGSDSYNLFKYKGGVNCNHFWMRQVYMQTDDKQISVNEARRQILELAPELRDEFRIPENEWEVAVIASEFNNFWKYNR